MPHKNQRVELEMKILQARRLVAEANDALTRERLELLIKELEQKLCEIDD